MTRVREICLFVNNNEKKSLFPCSPFENNRATNEQDVEWLHRFLLGGMDDDELDMDIIVIAKVKHESLNKASELLDESATAQPMLKKLEALTPRERQVLWLILDGLSGNKIAAGINRSVDDYKFHRKNLYLKLGVQSRSEIFFAAMREGWNIKQLKK